MNELLIEIKLLRKDVAYIREFIRDNEEAHKALDARVDRIDAFLNYVRGVGLFIGIMASLAGVWALV